MQCPETCNCYLESSSSLWQDLQVPAIRGGWSTSYYRLIDRKVNGRIEIWKCVICGCLVATWVKINHVIRRNLRKTLGVVSLGAQYLLHPSAFSSLPARTSTSSLRQDLSTVCRNSFQLFSLNTCINDI